MNRPGDDIGLFEAFLNGLAVEVGEDVNRDDLRKTPRRFASAMRRLLSGYGRSLAAEMTSFPNATGHHDLIVAGGISFFSMCEHHLLPFFGRAVVAYVPDKAIAGLSKLSRAVDIYARRLQQQERLAAEIAAALEETLHPRGVAVLLTAQHLCNMARGVSQTHSSLQTTTYRGVFLSDAALRSEFLSVAGNP